MYAWKSNFSQTFYFYAMVCLFVEKPATRKVKSARMLCNFRQINEFVYVSENLVKWEQKTTSFNKKVQELNNFYAWQDIRMPT